MYFQNCFVFGADCRVVRLVTMKARVFFLYSYMNSFSSIPLHPQVVDLVWDLCHNFWRMTTLPVSPDLRDSFRSEGSTLLIVFM